MTSHQRLPDWPERLVAVVAAHRRAPFEWGRYDCATLFADAVDAVAGFDPLAAHRPWCSELGAATRLLRARLSSVEALVAATFPAIEPSAARRGDLGYTTAAGPLTCPAVILGAEALVRTPDAISVVPREAILRAYRVG